MIKLKGGGHVEHHAETYDDMSLKKDERWRAARPRTWRTPTPCASHAVHC